MTSLFLLATALTLGLRHGIDWDHIAALLDISGANSGERSCRHPLALCFCYALGHGLIVFLLGWLAISFAAILPSWLDSIMERVVGLTLLALGIYLLTAVYQMATTGQLKLQSEEGKLKQFPGSQIEPSPALPQLVHDGPLRLSGRAARLWPHATPQPWASAC